MTGGSQHILGKQALEMLMRGDIEPTPLNYALCYRYLQGEDPNLVKAVDAALAKHKHLTHSLVEQLRRDFLGGSEAEKLSNLFDSGHLHLQRLSLYLEGAGGDAKHYRNVLEAGTDSLEATNDPLQQKDMLGQLMAATSAMIEKTQRLETQISTAGQEIAALRQDLDQARSESRTDPLTGLPNRRAFQVYLESQATRALVDKKPLSLLFCDIDHFKLFNDTWGHRLGDEVLRLISSSLEHLCNGIGFPARYGGEEFVIALPNKDLEAALDIAEQIRDFVGSRTLRAKNLNRSVGQITLSLGVSQLRWEDSLESLIERADAALYRAKGSGRNCVRSEEDQLDSIPTKAKAAR